MLFPSYGQKVRDDELAPLLVRRLGENGSRHTGLSRCCRQRLEEQPLVRRGQIALAPWPEEGLLQKRQLVIGTVERDLLGGDLLLLRGDDRVLLDQQRLELGRAALEGLKSREQLLDEGTSLIHAGCIRPAGEKFRLAVKNPANLLHGRYRRSPPLAPF